MTSNGSIECLGTPLPPDAHGGNKAVSGNDAMDAPDMGFGPLDLDSTMDDVHVFLSGRDNIQVPQPDDGTSQKSRTSAATDIAKRRNNWTRLILEEIKDMLSVLSVDGRIPYASPATKLVTEYRPDELSGTFPSRLIHEDDKTTFIREFHESIATGYRLRFPYRFRKSGDSFMILEASGHPHMAKEGKPCNGFFLICRHYPTRSCQLLDSFLEQKVENIRLTRRIADLKKEEEEELRAQQQWLHHSDSIGNRSPRDDREGFYGVPTLSADRGTMLPPAKPRPPTSGQEISLISLPDDCLDTVARDDPSSITDGIEMMTGLCYSEGERSQGLSTGDANASLVKDDADMHHLLGMSPGDNDKKNKKKLNSQ